MLLLRPPQESRTIKLMIDNSDSPNLPFEISAIKSKHNCLQHKPVMATGFAHAAVSK